MKNILHLLLFVSVFTFAQNAPTYYNSINFELEGEQMKQQLSSLITNTHDYTVSYNQLWDLLKQTDLSPNNPNKVMLIYGWDDSNQEDDDDLTRSKNATCGNGHSCTDDTWNREHVFPKGLDNSSSNNSGPTADPHMLRASDVEMNGYRGNHLFGEGNGVASYLNSSGDFYPGENWKGDVARIIMYMYVRYGNDWNPNYTGAGANTYHNDMPDIFLEWNAEDPVSEYEMNRNNIVNNYQGNRNPFIDNPYLATVIWGGPTANNTWPGSMSTVNLTYQDNPIVIYPNPTNDVVYLKGVEDKTMIRVYDLNGKLIIAGKNMNQITLPKTGIYIIQIHIGDTIHVEKVIRK